MPRDEAITAALFLLLDGYFGILMLLLMGMLYSHARRSMARSRFARRLPMMITSAAAMTCCGKWRAEGAGRAELCGLRPGICRRRAAADTLR